MKPSDAANGFEVENFYGEIMEILETLLKMFLKFQKDMFLRRKVLEVFVGKFFIVFFMETCERNWQVLFRLASSGVNFFYSFLKNWTMKWIHDFLFWDGIRYRFEIWCAFLCTLWLPEKKIMRHFDIREHRSNFFLILKKKLND